MSGKRGCELLLEVGNAAMSKKHKGHWSQGLLASITDQNLVVEEDDLMVIIKDKYPKVANDVSVCCHVAFCVVCVSLHCRTCKIPVARTAPGRSVISATVGTITAVAIVCSLVPGLFVPMHFRSHASLLLNKHTTTSLAYRRSPAVITNVRDGEEASITDG